MGNAIYSVWVGGVEVNDYYLTRTQAADVAKQYLADGYVDVFITENKEI